MPEVERPTCNSALSADEVTVDSFCIDCGYNLRGLPRQGLCPECGTLKSESLRTDLLQYADPAWRDAICRGLCLLAVVLWLTLATILISAASAIFAGFVYDLKLLESLGVVMRWTIAASSAGGFWLLSVPEPDDELMHLAARPRQAARLASVVIALSFIAGRFLPDQVTIWAVIIEQLAMILGVGSSLLIVGAMSLRLPSAKLHTRLVRRARGIPYVGACMLIAIIMYRISLHPASITEPYVHIFRSAVLVTSVILVLYMVFALFTLARFRPVLKEIARRAGTP